MVTQTRLDPSAVVTMSLALEVQVGRDPGAPGAFEVGIALQFTVISSNAYRPPRGLISAASGSDEICFIAGDWEGEE
jgi:hypothetical protein